MSRRRPRGPLEWVVRIVLALVLIGGGILAGKLIRGNNGTTVPTSGGSTVVTSPPPSESQDAATVKTGCGATTLMNARISEAQQLDEPSLLANITTGPGSPWYKVTGMETVGNDPTYAPLADQVRAFIQAYSITRTDGDVDTVANALTAVIASCQTLHENTDAAP